LRIPVKAHVKTFLEHPMNLGKGVADVRRDHWLGKLLLAILSFHPLDRRRGSKRGDCYVSFEGIEKIKNYTEEQP